MFLPALFIGFRYEGFKWLCISACEVITMQDAVALLPKRQNEHDAEVLPVGSRSRNLMNNAGSILFKSPFKHHKDKDCLSSTPIPSPKKSKKPYPPSHYPFHRKATTKLSVLYSPPRKTKNTTQKDKEYHPKRSKNDGFISKYFTQQNAFLRHKPACAH